MTHRQRHFHKQGGAGNRPFPLGGNMIKVGDVIDGRKVTRVYELCGGTAYDSVPVNETIEPVEEAKEEPKKRIRRKKEQ